MKSTVADYRYRSLCLRIVPVVGATIRLTHYTRNLTMSNSTVYLSSSGYDFTGYSSNTTLSAAVIDLEGIAGIAGISRDQIASGLYDGARAYLYATTWKNPIEDEEPIVCSILGKTTLINDRYTIEEMALIDALGQSVGETYQPQCPKTFGGQEYAGCGVHLGPLTVTGTITSIATSLIFTDSSRTEIDDYFGAGTIQITSGSNAGLKAQEIKSYTAAGVITIFEPFYYALNVGDTYSMIPGCRKRYDVDCYQKWGNINNFGGFTFMPISSTYGKIGTN